MTLSLLQYAEALKRRAQEQDDRVQRALKRVADQGATMARKRTLEVARDTGRFAHGWRSEDRDDGAAVVNLEAHAPYVDDGRAPEAAAPPIAVLIRWVERKMHVGGKEAERIAWLISREIAERGIRGKQIAAWLAKKLAPVAQREVAKEQEKL